MGRETTMAKRHIKNVSKNNNIRVEYDPTEGNDIIFLNTRQIELAIKEGFVEDNILVCSRIKNPDEFIKKLIDTI